MSFFDTEQTITKTKNKTPCGAKPKHNFELMEVGGVKPFPSGVKLSSLRVMLSNKGKDHGMKFKVDSTNKTIARIA